jgi:geranylgeranyl pyrophosphate synthase
VILAVAEGDALRDLLGHPLDGDALNEARQIVRSDGAVPRAIGMARHYASEAAAALGDLPDGPAVAALRDLGDRLVDSVPA